MLPLAQEHLRHHGMASGKFLYVPNGVDPDEWAGGTPVALPSAHAAAIAEARSHAHVLVAYAGAHGVANDLGTLLDAAALARNEPITWLLIGSGPEKAALARRVIDEKLRNVMLLDPVPKSVIPELLREMDILYLGLRNEPLFRFGISPNKLMDYMMAGRPVVCAIAAGNDIVGEAGCGITVSPGQPQASARAIGQLASLSSEARATIGRKGRDYVLARHTYPVLAGRFLEAVLPNEH
jgi:glycosyltransferase involved in cell wall biosynthesis